MWLGARAAIPPTPDQYPEGVRLSPEETDELVEAIAVALGDAELTVDELGEAIVDRLVERAAELRSRDDSGTPEGSLLQAEERLAVRRALAQLPEPDRVALIGRYFLALTDDEAASLLGVGATSARVRIWRALRRVEKLVERDEP